jgi:hypothetical protein
MRERDDGVERFRDVYADPVRVNGQLTDVRVLAARARMLQQAIEGAHHELHEIVITPGRRAFAFTISGRHTGALSSPVGEIAATDADLSVTGLDIFTVDEATQQVTEIWAVADWLGPLLQCGALTTESIGP